MRINSINYTQNHKTSFRANERWIYNEFNKPLFRTTTSMLRPDLNWREYIYKICNKYKNDAKVNVLIHACSNGLEALTFVMALLHLKPKEADKFCPIIAKDLVKDNIEQAQTGRFEISLQDIARMNNFTLGNCNKFFNTSIRGTKFFLEPKQEVLNRVIFEQGNIFDDISNLPEEKTILHARNFLTYLPLKDKERLINGISHKFQDNSSTLVLGDYDMNEHTESLLDKYNFSEDLTVHNVYTKVKNFNQYSRFLY